MTTRVIATGCLCWRLDACEGGFERLWVLPQGAVTIFIDDLDARVAAIANAGLKPDQREPYPNGVRKVVFGDPDRNEPGFGDPLLGSSA